jgi:phage gpG-like protein
VIIEAIIDPNEVAALTQDMRDELQFAAMSMQAAMAAAYVDVIAGNLGDSGVDRPFAWPPLSPAYAKKVGRSHATLYVTGELARAVKTDNSLGNHSTVSVSDDDCPYAVAHQYGYPPRNLPARPYFPFDPQTGETTPFTLELVQQAAEAALETHLAVRRML